MASTVFSFLIPIALLVVFAVLLTGIYSLYRGGDFARNNSNKLMRLRVVAQFAAIIVIMMAFYFTR